MSIHSTTKCKWFQQTVHWKLNAISKDLSMIIDGDYIHFWQSNRAYYDRIERTMENIEQVIADYNKSLL